MEIINYCPHFQNRRLNRKPEVSLLSSSYNISPTILLTQLQLPVVKITGDCQGGSIITGQLLTKLTAFNKY